MRQYGRVTRRGFLCAAAALGSGSRLFRAAGQDSEGNAKFSSDVKVVSVLATVRDKKGQIIHNLLKDDFVLTEEGKPQNIKYFSQQTDLQLTLGLLVDTSGSQRRVLGQEEDATFTFIERVLREKKDQTFLIQFAHEAELLRDLTGSKKELEDALRQIGNGSQPQLHRFLSEFQGYPGQGGGYPGQGGGYPGGQGRGRGGRAGTVLYDAIYLASNEIMKKQSGRKALIVLSDGVDNGSKIGITESIASAQRADTLVYSILFSDRDAYNRQPMGGYGGRRHGGGYPPSTTANHPDGKKILQRISQETGGGFFEVSSKHPIEKIYDQIEEELRNQYSLGYTSNITEGPGYRRIALTVDKKDLIVQSRTGYYAN
jgi:VWFA-related protein